MLSEETVKPGMEVASKDGNKYTILVTSSYGAIDVRSGAWNGSYRLFDSPFSFTTWKYYNDGMGY